MAGARWVGWRYTALIGSLVGAVALAMYPIFIDPYMNPDKWSKLIHIHVLNNIIARVMVA